jgi:hypothetical protein
MALLSGRESRAPDPGTLLGLAATLAVVVVAAVGVGVGVGPAVRFGTPRLVFLVAEVVAGAWLCACSASSASWAWSGWARRTCASSSDMRS